MAVNETPRFDDISEMRLRDKVLLRLETHSETMDPQQYQRWVDLLNDEEPHGRTLAITAALTMMDVVDGPMVAQSAREQFDLLRKDR